MPRPRHANPSPAALRKREQRDRAEKRIGLVPVKVWVPPHSVKYIEHVASIARKHAHLQKRPE